MLGILNRNAVFFTEVVGEWAFEVHEIVELHVFRLRLGFAVEIDHVVFDLQGLSRAADTAFHVILAAIDRTTDDLAYLRLLFAEYIPPGGIDFFVGHALQGGRQRVSRLMDASRLRTGGVNQLIVIHCLEVGGHRIARGIVEHHDVSGLHLPEAFDAPVVPFRPFDVALATAQPNGQIVLGEGHRQRRLRNARAVAQFRHEQIVARQEGFLQRRGGDDEILEEIEIQEVDGHQGKDNGIDPPHERPHDPAGGFAPPVPIDETRGVEIDDKGHEQQAPPRFHPIEEKEIEREDNAEGDPLSCGDFWLFIHEYFSMKWGSFRLFGTMRPRFCFRSRRGRRWRGVLCAALCILRQVLPREQTHVANGRRA